MSNIQLTKNFTLKEFTRSSTATQMDIDNDPRLSVVYNLRTLCETVLQPIRNLWGSPIFITSGYRSAELNKAVGGATNSDHMYGTAADLRPIPYSPERCRQLFDIIKQMINTNQITVKQLIDEKNYSWIHISFQDGRTTKKNQILHL